ncbi:Uncharacterised protein [Chlamydia trachomatis]|nr:Uncharacterised protein [Chlamydia trachomatis]
MSFILGLVFKFAISEKYLTLSSYLFVFALLITTVLFSSIKALNIFKIYYITRPIAIQIVRRFPAMLITIAAMITLPIRMII